MCLDRRHELNNNPRPQASVRPAQPHAKFQPASLPQSHARPVSPSSGHSPSRTRRAQICQRPQPFPQSLRLAHPRRYTNPAPGGLQDAARRTRQSGSAADLEGHRRSDALGEERQVRGAWRSGSRPQQETRSATGGSLRGVGRLARALGFEGLARQKERLARSVGPQAASLTARSHHHPPRGD